MAVRFSVAILGMLTMGMTQASATQLSTPETVTVEIIRQQSEVLLGGTVVPARQVTIAAQMPGRVEFIAGAEGDAFNQDTALVALDDDELLAQRRAAMAQMQSADAAMRNAGVQFNRELISPSNRSSMPGMGMPGLFDQMFTRNFSDMMGIGDSGMERHADLYSRSIGIEQARSAFLQARSQLEAVDAKLRDSVGYAPFNGVIVSKVVEVGDTVQPGQPLLTFADTEALQIQVDVPARLMPGVMERAQVMARLDVHNTPVKARVAQIYPMADAVRHTVTVKLDLPLNAPAAPGMYAEVMMPDITAPITDLPVVPRSAIVQRGSLPAVYVLNQEGKRELRLIRVGQSVGEGRVGVLSGLNGGERVINNLQGVNAR
jgi:multidrug efflux pump subunit AcrA (membrane-fusion protein)